MTGKQDNARGVTRLISIHRCLERQEQHSGKANDKIIALGLKKNNDAEQQKPKNTLVIWWQKIILTKTILSSFHIHHQVKSFKFVTLQTFATIEFLLDMHFYVIKLLVLKEAHDRLLMIYFLFCLFFSKHYIIKKDIFFSHQSLIKIVRKHSNQTLRSLEQHTICPYIFWVGS